MQFLGREPTASQQRQCSGQCGNETSVPEEDGAEVLDLYASGLAPGGSLLFPMELEPSLALGTGAWVLLSILYTQCWA